ncbi:glycogen debranching N-terminal domain-containing protein [Actinophytocola oryzae]|uniref:amylo-alpha-1,6-glucosidase n=1 Tax=Actinophytocola oryzae TaxID=502181 RepID=UPI001FB99C9D|nr:glycogen debranching N-terminal domain-containing protein [Actinophytocola oryzae]
MSTRIGGVDISGPFNAGEAVHAGGITTVEGSAFCLSGAEGNITPGAAHGLFLDDARVLSRWELAVDGLTPLSVRQPAAFQARFVSRRAPDLLVCRDRLVGDGMSETISVDNVGDAADVRLDLAVAADFADLFAVKEGRAAGAAHASVEGDALVLRGRGRHVSVSATGEPELTTEGLTWRVHLPARSRWEAEVTVGTGRPFDRTRPARRLEAWLAGNTRITAEDPALAEVLRRTESDLGALRIDGPRPYVAAGAPWFMTLFGRDSLLTAWMALPLDPGLALGTLRTLAESQGTRVDPATEEEPGRIMHELRRGPDSAALLGGERYYGTADATPLFVMLLAQAWRWGVAEDAVRALLPAADAALSWVDGHGDFVTYRRATDRGLANQGWKDSPDAVNHADGRLATGPIALCEVQGYAYAAWLARAELAEAFGEDPTRHRARAEALRTRFAERFWLPRHGWYAVALDGDGAPVDALTSNTAHCLWTGIATDEHAATLVARLSEPDMDTGYGLRTLASTMGAHNPMSYHNGSVWPHDTAIAVAGLMRYAHLPGAVDLAHRLAVGLLDAATAFGGRLPELYCGLPRTEFAPPVPFPTSCSPQAWASAAPLLVVRALLGLEPHVPHGTVTTDPRLPAHWGEITLTGRGIGTVTAGGRCEHGQDRPG